MRHFFTDYNLEWLPSFMVVFFSIIFVTILYLVLRKESRKHFDNMERLPLEDELTRNKGN